MDRTERAYRAALARGDRAALSILDGVIDRLCGVPQVYDAVVEQEADDAPIGTVRWYPIGDYAIADIVVPERCTAPTGIASHPVCGGTRHEHGTINGPLHTFMAVR